MAEIAADQAQPLRANVNTSIAPVVLAPVIAVGFLLGILFAPILGVQATEIAHLIQDAETDLTALLRGYQAKGTFYDLQPKFLIFSCLMIGWGLVASTVTLSLAEAIRSRRLRFLLAHLVSCSLPAVVALKYLAANWAEPQSRLPSPIGILNHPMLAHLPAFEPGGLWIFAALLLLQTVAIQVIWHMVRSRRPDPVAGGGIPNLLLAAVAVFVAGSLGLQFAPPLTATWFGTINTIILFVTLLYVFVAGLIHYLQTSSGLKIVAALGLYAIAVNAAGLFVASPRAAKPKMSAAAAPARTASSSEDQFRAWYRNRPKSANPAQPTPIFVIAASGGGMRASIRTVTFLDHMQTKCPDFMRHTFAISGVSGGALGALLFAAQQQLQTGQETGCNLAELGLPEVGSKTLFPSAPLLEQFFATDVLPAIVGPGLFTETLQRFLPPGLLPSFDRSVSFNEVLAASWHETVLAYQRKHGVTLPTGANCKIQDYLKSCDSNSYWDPAKNTPLLVFNATSVTDGGLVPLSNVDHSYFQGLPLSRSINARGGSSVPFKFELLEAASASARFPIALPAATLAGVDGRVHTLVDGAYFDNSGLLVARAIKKRVEAIIAESQTASAGTSINARVHIIYLRERETNKLNCENMMAWLPKAADAASQPDGNRSSDLAHFNAFLRSRDMRDLMNEYLINELDKASIIDIAWDLHEQPAMLMATSDGPAQSTGGLPDCEHLREVSPLAFYYAPTTRWKFKIFLENELLDPKNAPSLTQVQKLLRPEATN